MNLLKDPLPAIVAEMAVANARGGASDAHKMPATKALLDDAAAALARGIPARFEHGGKTFFMRVSIGLARIEVFSDPGTNKPLCKCVHGAFESYGHRPGH